MFPLSQAQHAQFLYGPRAAAYDSTWHAAHARDFVKHASLQQGQHVLDLACGTGLVSIPAAGAVGPKGSVTGVGITSEMLEIAKKKAREDARCKGVVIRFLQHDITDLDILEGKVLTKGKSGYDCITCASALPLLEGPGRAMKQWAKFLKMGGRMVIDVPTERSQIPGLVYEQSVAAVGVVVPFGRLRMKGKEWLETLMKEAGMEVERSFVASGYGSASIYEKEQAGDLFDRWVEGPVGAMVGGISNDVQKRAKAREFFMKAFARRAGAEGKVKEEEGFYIVVGRKV
ncbi:hypothetical protein MMC30_007038 [Trapelia coarctata]|nr:hypothetical protein [Trapelia coarctata]